jgi:hypothetical protein
MNNLKDQLVLFNDLNLRINLGDYNTRNFQSTLNLIGSFHISFFKNVGSKIFDITDNREIWRK